MRDKSKSGLTVFEAHILLLVTFAIYLGFSRLNREQMLPGGPLVIMIAGQMLLSLPCIIYLAVRRFPLKEVLGFNPISWENVKMAAMVTVCTYPLIGLLNFLTMLFVENKVSGVLEYFLPYGFQISLFVMAILPAVNEEILCRGMLYGSYRRRAPVKGVLLSALVFGLFHMNLNQLPYACLLGVVFALMNEATGSVLTSILMHFLLNGFNVLTNFAAAARGLTAGEEPVNYMEMITGDPGMLRMTLICVFIILVIFVPLTIFMIIRTFKLNQRVMPARKGRLTDPLIILFAALAVFFTWENTIFIK